MEETIYLRIILWYRDGTRNELKAVIPDNIADAIQQKGMEYASVFVDRYIGVVVPSNMQIDSFVQRG